MREKIRERLAPLTDWIPAEVRGRFDVEVWWLFELVAALLVLVVVGYSLRGLLRGLFRRRRGPAWDRALMLDVDDSPYRPGPASLVVQHVPARLRFVVVAPGGTGQVVEPEVVTRLLDRVVPGLGAVAEYDRPQILIWPAQLSATGFTALFHRCTPTGEPAGATSQWVFLAGRAQGGGQALFLGLGLWADRPTTLGRMNVEPNQWLGVLRPSAAERGA